MEYVDIVGFVLVVIGSVMAGIGLYYFGINLLRPRVASTVSKFDMEIAKLKNFGEILEEITKASNNREVSEFTFRDQKNNLDTVKIVIDHDLPSELSDEDKAQMELIEMDNYGVVGEILDGEKGINQVKEFVFSERAIRDMRSVGLEPEDVVVRMLKASGRM